MGKRVKGGGKSLFCVCFEMGFIWRYQWCCLCSLLLGSSWFGSTGERRQKNGGAGYIININPRESCMTDPTSTDNAHTVIQRLSERRREITFSKKHCPPISTCAVTAMQGRNGEELAQARCSPSETNLCCGSAESAYSRGLNEQMGNWRCGSFWWVANYTGIINHY